MNPIRQGALRFDELQSVIPLPGLALLARAVPAGFPSPAADDVEGRIDLNEHLAPQREASFLVRVAGDSMRGFGIHHNDLLVVDRSLTPADRSIVVAVIDGEFTLKQLCRMPHGILLRAGAQGFSDILLGEAQELTIWGVVRCAIHAVWPCPDASP